MPIKPESSGDPLVDLAMRGVGRLIPPRGSGSISAERRQRVRRRNLWHDVISQLMCLLGLAAGVVLPAAVRGRPVEYSGWDIGVAFGLGIGLPTLYVLTSIRLRSRERFEEFLDFYSLKYGVDAGRLFVFGYAPVILFGLASAYFSYFHQSGQP